MEVSLLDAARVPATARVLAAAMEVDPVYRHLFPDPEVRAEGLADFFRRNLALHIDHRCVYVASQAQVLATVTLRPVEGVHIGALAMLQHGALPFAATHGLSALRRLLWIKRTYEALDRDAARGSASHYLHMMGVTPGRQGQGIGGELLSAVLDRVRHPVVLTTHLPQNVAFYGRFGFGVVGEGKVRPPGGEPGWTVWSMRR